MTDELKARIKYESGRAAQLSREAITAYEANNKVQGSALMKEAVIASKNCQKLIEQFNQSTEVIASGEASQQPHSEKA